MKKLTIILLAAMLVIGTMFYLDTFNNESVPEAQAKGAVYSGTVYIAGMGGHFSVAEVEVDPSNTEQPISVKGLNKMDIGNSKSHPTHDPRIDVNDRSRMYWSTYKIDKEKEGKYLHVGLSDLKSGKVLKDVAIKVDGRAKWTGAMYCASGQTKTSFIPVTMSGESYIDVFDKKSFDLKHRVFLDDIGYKNNYFFYHGTNSPDLKKFAMAINMTEEWKKPTAPAPRNGNIDIVLLDLEQLENGKVKVLAKNTVTGNPKKTLTFRQTFTPDGKYLLQSGGDRFYLLEAGTLKLLDEEMMEDGENHDAVPTPDGKYALLTVRTKDDKRTDGALQLYDVQAKKVIGKPSSVCVGCHADMVPGNAILCGADVNWN